MFKKVIKSLLVSLVGFTLVIPFAFAQESSLPNVDELIQEVKALRMQISQLKETADEAREIAVDSRLEAEKFKEETLYRLGLWRERLGRGMMMSISAQDAAERVEKLAKTASEQVSLALSRVKEVERRINTLSEKLSQETQARANLQRNVDNLSQDVESLKTDVSLAKQMAATAKTQADTAIKELDKKINALRGDVESLKTDVSLAKQMAATAKAQADQARKEVRELRDELRKTKELFLGKVEKELGEIKEKEEKFKAEKVKLEAPAAKMMIYKVEKGDSLWRIAAKVYNNPAKWRKIFEANKERLATPDSLYPGQKLVIPQE